MPILGSTDAFPLRALLEFLSGARRTGRLVVQTNGHTALFALRDGHAVAAGVAAGVDTPGVALADDPRLLADIVSAVEALGPGQFAFHAGGIGGTATGFDVAIVLALVDGGRGVDASPTAHALAHADRWVSLASQGAATPQPIDEADWAVLRAVGDGVEVGVLAGRLGTTVSAMANRLAVLVGRGLVAIDQPALQWAAPAGQGS